MALKTKDALVSSFAPAEAVGNNKVTVVGTGSVGMACAIVLLTKGITNELALVDCVEDKVMGEMLDLQHGSKFLNSPKITAGTDYVVSAGSRVCVITSGIRGTVDQSRMELLQANVELMQKIIPELVKHSPNAVLLLVANPVDVMTYAAWKISGLPPNRVIGSGTNLDSSRFRFLVAQRLGVPVSNCKAWMIGEHGETCVPVWSQVNVAGVRLRELNPAIGTESDQENWEEIYKEMQQGAFKVIEKKGYTCWAIGLSVTSIVASILNNTGDIHCVTFLAKGHHGIKDDAFLSLPVALGSSGVVDVIKQTLTDSERDALQKSAAFLVEVQNSLSFGGSAPSGPSPEPWTGACTCKR